MLSFSRLLLMGSLICVPYYAFSADEFSEVKDAQDQVSEYRALRKACAITKGEQRKICFSQLNASTQGYQKAKKFLAMQQPSGGALLGQAQ